MNKTVKTIAWICLVLGLLGIAVDVGMVVRAQTLRARVAERIEDAELPEATDKGDGGKGQGPGGSREWPGNQDGKVAPIGGISRGNRGRLGRNARRSGLPLALIAAGPVLAVIGGVTLIVNREPKNKDSKSPTKKTKKSKKE